MLRNRMIRLITIGCVAICLAAQDAPTDPTPEETLEPQQPNIVIFLADDLGWRDVGYHGSEIKTPNLDSLAMAGVRLEQFYVQSICTPTRAALMTGRYPFRYGLRTITPWIQYGLPTEERTLADALKESGYRTAIVGKWHLGHNDPKYLPTQRGFDHQYGCYCGAIDYHTHKRGKGLDWHRDDKALNEKGYATLLIADEASRLIEEHDTSSPLFLYVAFTAPHMPLQAPEKYIEQYMTIRGKTRRTYAAMVACLDDSVGQIMDSLESRGMRENTLVVFSSDNGGAKNCGSNNTPFRGYKKSDHEGALRVPAFFNWPGHLEPAVVKEPLHIIDLFPTLVTVAGGSLEQPLELDGVDIWKTLTEGEPSPHEEIVLYMSQGRAAIRRGDWKLIIEDNNLQLYNLAEDPREFFDQSAKRVPKLQELLKRIAFYKKLSVPTLGAGAQARPKGFPAPEVWGEQATELEEEH